jgi:WhiB family transcriptional regulator, redox-sensing transcriptional regulator
MTTIPGHADWREAGACAQLDPDLFFPISSTGPAREQIAKAKAICGACPVRRPCLEFALEHDLAAGIGGLRRSRRAARRSPRGGTDGDGVGTSVDAGLPSVSAEAAAPVR